MALVASEAHLVQVALGSSMNGGHDAVIGPKYLIDSTPEDK
jgi:hypothetical protein